jgi:hypothetical protein
MIDAQVPPGDGAGTFAADGWHTVAEGRLALAARARLLPPVLVLVALAGLNQGVARIWLAAAAAALIVLPWYPLGRSARTWRYRERGQDLLIDHGLLIRRQVAVPYGRMQFVDIVAGPAERALGICTLRLHTASASTDARIPGLEPGRAEQLRDRLAALGEARMAGL